MTKYASVQSCLFPPVLLYLHSHVLINLNDKMSSLLSYSQYRMTV